MDHAKVRYGAAGLEVARKVSYLIESDFLSLLSFADEHGEALIMTWIILILMTIISSRRESHGYIDRSGHRDGRAGQGMASRKGKKKGKQVH